SRAPGPAHRHLAAALSLSLVDRPGGTGGRTDAGTGPLSAVRAGRRGDAGRRLYDQRHLRPELRREGRPHRDAAAALRRDFPPPGARFFGRPAGDRPADPRPAVADGDLAGRGVPGPGDALSPDEADHLVAPGVAGPHLQLGRTDGL